MNDAPQITIEFHQQDFIPGFAAFLPGATTPVPHSRAFCVLNVGSFLASIEAGDADREELPYAVAESMMHEIMHVLEQHFQVAFSEDRIEALLDSYRAFALADTSNNPAPRQDDEPALACLNPIGCTAPCHDDDGVSYCDVCGRFEGCRTRRWMILPRPARTTRRQDDEIAPVEPSSTPPAPRPGLGGTDWRPLSSNVRSSSLATPAPHQDDTLWHVKAASRSVIEDMASEIARLRAELAALTVAARAVVDAEKDRSPYSRSDLPLAANTLRAVLASQTPREHPDLSGLRRALNFLPLDNWGRQIRAEIARLEQTP